MRDRIEQALQVLIGLPLRSAGRAADLVWFQFGNLQESVQSNKQEPVVGEYALHVQCAWRISGPVGIIVGSDDCYFSAGDDPFRDYPNFDWDQPGANRCDERIAMFFQFRANAVPIVDAVQVDRTGGFRLDLSGEISLEVFPNHSLMNEYWRLLRPSSDEQHFVVTGQGVEE